MVFLLRPPPPQGRLFHSPFFVLMSNLKYESQSKTTTSLMDPWTTCPVQFKKCQTLFFLLEATQVLDILSAALINESWKLTEVCVFLQIQICKYKHVALLHSGYAMC